MARNSSQSSLSSNVVTQSQAYRHPIVYDKLTGATNNQINDVLGAKQPAGDYPIDHYQQQQLQQQQQQQQHLQFKPQTPQEEFFNNIHRQTPPGFPPHPLGPHNIGMGPPMVQIQSPLMTTASPMGQQSRGQPLQLGPMPMAPIPPQPPSGNQRQSSADQSNLNPQPGGDSLPSASSVLANNNARPSSNLTQPQQQQQLAQLNQQLNQQNQPVYYTPPIFAYNNFDQNRQLTDPQLNQNLPYGFPQQTQQPSLGGVPEVPVSIDEYNARQARLRQLNQQLQPLNEVSQSDRYGKPQLNNQLPQRIDATIVDSQFPQANQQPAQQSQNLLADPQQQQRHKQQMLDRQLLFGHPNQAIPFLQAPEANLNQTRHYPDPALLYRPPMLSGQANNIRPPYAHNMPVSSQTELEQLSQIGKPQQSAQNRILPSSSRNDQNQQQVTNKLASSTPSDRQLSPLLKGSAGFASNNLPVVPAATNSKSSIPVCAARQQVGTSNELIMRNLELINSTNQMPALFCNEDPEYPTKDIMRALEVYATERSIEQLLPQLLVQIQLAQRGNVASVGSNSNTLADIQRQLSLDSLQPTISTFKQTDPTTPVVGANGQLVGGFEEQRQPLQLFPSANYEPLCRSTVYMAQPRRAKNLFGQWKIVVNLPGHKYRGIAVSQMVRIEECSRPNSECATPSTTNNNSALRSNQPSVQQSSSGQLLPRSRCLQQYENQRLVAWSHQQGLHLDIFRVPITCSCHIRR